MSNHLPKVKQKQWEGSIISLIWVSFYFQTPLNKVGDSIFKSVYIDRMLFSECRHYRLSQWTEAMTRCPTCEIPLGYTESGTQERFGVYLSIISINEKPKFRKILNMVLVLTLFTWYLQFLLHIEASAFHHRKHVKSWRFLMWELIGPLEHG